MCIQLSLQVTQGHQHGDLILPIPSLDVLTEGALTGSTERRAIVIHIMETCVVSWMKQVKVIRTLLILLVLLSCRWQCILILMELLLK